MLLKVQMTLPITAVILISIIVVGATQSNSAPFPELEFNDVRVEVLERTNIESGDGHKWYVLSLKVKDDCIDESGVYDLMKGDTIYAYYNTSSQPELHDVSDGEELKIDFNMMSVHSPDKNYSRVATISSMERPDYVEPIFYWMMIITIITLIILIILLIRTRKEIEVVEKELDEEIKE